MSHVLLVDDEEPLRVSLSFTLTREGYRVTTASDGPSGLELARQVSPDVVLLDVMLPGMSGIEVCQRIRTFSDVPILMLTAKDLAMDKVQGLEVGADDYVTKPFNTRELLARMKAVMRRRTSVQRLLQEDRALLARVEGLLRPAADTPEERAPAGQGRSTTPPATVHPPLTGGPVRMDLARREVTVHDRPVDLSPDEFALLRVLLTHKGRVVTRTELIESVWGGRSTESLTRLEAHIRWLREKIETNPAEPRLITAIPGIGYRFE